MEVYLPLQAVKFKHFSMCDQNPKTVQCALVRSYFYLRLFCNSLFVFVEAAANLVVSRRSRQARQRLDLRSWSRLPFTNPRVTLDKPLTIYPEGCQLLR